jgi:catechol 2,3-dioxygenase-like lactoylglutathione lyase family enzyme
MKANPIANPWSRRGLLQAMSLAPLCLTARLNAQQAVLPLNTPGVDHLDIIVPDVEASARFYMALFNTRLHAQPFQGGLRYFVLLGEMGPNREVGYIAIGDARGRGTDIGHFCTSVYDYRRDAPAIAAAMKTAFTSAGFGEFPGATGVGGIFQDPDGIEIQFLPAPDVLVTVAEPADLVPAGQGLVKPLGVDHVLLSVSNLDRAVEYYSLLYGSPSREDVGLGRVFFDFPASGTFLMLEQQTYAYGKTPAIEHFCIKVEAFDEAAVKTRLEQLGAVILPSPDEPGVLRFRDLDNIVVELQPV